MTRLSDSNSETALIGMAIERPDSAARICDALSLNDFSNSHTKAAFIAISDLVESGEPLDLTEISDRLKAKGSDWETSQNDLFRWQSDAPLTSDREISSRVTRLKNTAARRSAYAAAKALMDKAETGGSKEFESALSNLGNISGTRTEPTCLQLVYKWAADITPQKPQWIWKGWLVRGGLHLLAGQQSAGKSTWTAHVTAQLMQGKLGSCKGIKVGYISLEESGDRLSGRFTVAGGDPTKIAIYETIRDFDKSGNAFDRPWRLPQDISVLSSWIEELGLSFVIVDGLGYAVAGAQDYATIGSALSALAKVAETTSCAILGLTHVKKGGTADAVTAAIGSTAWTAVPRIVWVLGLDPEDDTDKRRLVAVSKTNYKEPDSGFSFEIANDEESEVGYATNVDISNVSAHAIVAPKENREERSERREAKDFLQRVLANGPVSSKEFQDLAKEEGISSATLKRARGDLGVISQPQHGTTGKVTGWELRLPTSNGKSNEPLEPLERKIGHKPWSVPVEHQGITKTANEPLEPLASTSAYTDKNNQRTTGSLAFLSPDNEQATCRVCGKPLLLESSVVLGICARKDDAHLAEVK